MCIQGRKALQTHSPGVACVDDHMVDPIVNESCTVAVMIPARVLIHYKYCAPVYVGTACISSVAAFCANHSIKDVDVSI